MLTLGIVVKGEGSALGSVALSAEVKTMAHGLETYGVGFAMTWRPPGPPNVDMIAICREVFGSESW